MDIKFNVMKKLLFTTLVLLYGFTYVNAQEKAQFGVKGGINVATITEDADFVNFDSRTCFHIGVVMELPISETFSFQPELLFSCQGADYSLNDDVSIDEPTKAANGFEGSVKLNYLNVPLMAKYYVVEGLNIEAGPQLGFLLSAKDEYDYPGESGEEDIKDYVKGIDFGINFGIGYKLEGGLNFGARYNLGLSDANDNIEELGDQTLKNRLFQFSLGYFF